MFLRCICLLCGDTCDIVKEYYQYSLTILLYECNKRKIYIPLNQHVFSIHDQHVFSIHVMNLLHTLHL